jgi:acyl carrier protein
LAALTGDERDAALLDLVRAQAAEALGHSSTDAVPPDKVFIDLGFDSLTAVELRNRLTEQTGLAFPATLTFDYPTSLALRDYLREALFGADAGPAESALAELDRLEELLSAVAADDGTDEATRNQVLLRVQEVAAKFGDRGGQSEQAQLIAAADDDELFDFINRRLGGPNQ